VAVTGECCGAGAVLDKADACCRNSTSTKARLDKSGACCPSGVVNKCGVCDGPLVAVKSDDGQRCCVNGVKDAAGACCPSGVRDAVGVCDGQNDSVQQGMTLGLGTLPDGYTQAALDNSTSPERLALDASVIDTLASSLNRTTGAIAIHGYTVAGGVRRQRRLTTATADVVLLPYGGPNNLTAADISTLLTTAPSSPSSLVTVTSVVGEPVVAVVCGNSVCETGERPDTTSDWAGCPEDCPLPIVTCPIANGAVCNGDAAGTCIAEGGVGVCACNAAAGYTGPACAECGPGFLHSPTSISECSKEESAAALDAVFADRVAAALTPSASPGPSGSTGSSSKTALVVGVVVGVGGGLILLGVVAGVAVHTRAKRAAAKQGSKVVQVTPRVGGTVAGASAAAKGSSPPPSVLMEEGRGGQGQGQAALPTGTNPMYATHASTGQGPTMA
jgi:hypothetical protein